MIKLPKFKLSNILTKKNSQEPEKQDIVISRRKDEGVAKDYRFNGIIPGEKSGKFSITWLNPATGKEYSSRSQAKKDTPFGTKLTSFPETRNQISVLSSAIDSYDYYPDEKKLIVRYVSNPDKEYTFERVTKKRKEELDDAASKGRFVYYVLRKYNRAKGY